MAERKNANWQQASHKSRWRFYTSVCNLIHLHLQVMLENSQMDPFPGGSHGWWNVGQLLVPGAPQVLTDHTLHMLGFPRKKFNGKHVDRQMSISSWFFTIKMETPQSDKIHLQQTIPLCLCECFSLLLCILFTTNLWQSACTCWVNKVDFHLETVIDELDQILDEERNKQLGIPCKETHAQNNSFWPSKEQNWCRWQTQKRNAFSARLHFWDHAGYNLTTGAAQTTKNETQRIFWWNCNRHCQRKTMSMEDHDQSAGDVHTNSHKHIVRVTPRYGDNLESWPQNLYLSKKWHICMQKSDWSLLCYTNIGWEPLAALHAFAKLIQLTSEPYVHLEKRLAILW